MKWFLVFVFFYANGDVPTVHWWGTAYSSQKECALSIDQRPERLMSFFKLDMIVSYCKLAEDGYAARRDVKDNNIITGLRIRGP